MSAGRTRANQEQASSPEPRKAQVGRKAVGGAERRSPVPRTTPAEALLAAARELLISDGISGLTVDAVTRKAGLNKAAVSYYFGGKAGLVAAVVDIAVQDMDRELVRAAKELPPGEDRTRFYIEGMQRIAEDEEAYRAWFGMLPYLLTNATVRQRIRTAYDQYYGLTRECLSPSEGVAGEDLDAISRLITATVDGLAIQRAVASGEADLTRAFRLLSRMVELLVEDLEGEGRGD
jgi:AcrR family transcriptional regulator